jgi:hypothetical protein
MYLGTIRITLQRPTAFRLIIQQGLQKVKLKDNIILNYIKRLLSLSLYY